MGTFVDAKMETCIDTVMDEIQKRKAGRGKAKKDQLVQRLPGLEHKYPFEALMEDELEQEVAALDVKVEDQQLAHVVRTGRLVRDGRGRITIDSGAAESVMPEGVLPSELAVEGKGRRELRGARMDNVGENKAKLKRDGAHGTNDITFHPADASKPLALFSRMLDNGNRVVFSRGAEGWCIENAEAGVWMPLKEERGAFCA